MRVTWAHCNARTIGTGYGVTLKDPTEELAIPTQ